VPPDFTASQRVTSTSPAAFSSALAGAKRGRAPTVDTSPLSAAAASALLLRDLLAERAAFHMIAGKRSSLSTL
jgi:hypothetical protein